MKLVGDMAVSGVGHGVLLEGSGFVYRGVLSLKENPSGKIDSTLLRPDGSMASGPFVVSSRETNNNGKQGTFSEVSWLDENGKVLQTRTTQIDGPAGDPNSHVTKESKQPDGKVLLHEEGSCIKSTCSMTITDGDGKVLATSATFEKRAENELKVLASYTDPSGKHIGSAGADLEIRKDNKRAAGVITTFE